MRTHSSLLVLAAVVGISSQTVLVAQDAYERDETKLATSATKRLLRFVRTAEKNRVFSRAKEAYELVLEHYDPANEKAHKALDHEFKDGAWEAPRVSRPWPDDASDEERFKVVGEWKDVAEGIARLHRELGAKMLDDAPERAKKHYQLALYYDPFDEDSHRVVGHQSLSLDWGDGRDEAFWGTEKDVAFVTRLREIERFAAELSSKEYDVEPVPELPPQLARMVRDDPEIQFHGAKSDTFTVFVRGTQKNADDCVLWAERAVDFLHFLLPDDYKSRIDLRDQWKRRRGWMGFLWTTAEQKKFVELNPEIGGNDKWLNIAWGEDGKVVEIARALTPVTQHDGLIARISRLFGGNDAAQEGIMHATTWYLRSTAASRYGAESTATSTGARKILPDSANWWMRAMRDQATARTDFPLNGLPRVQLSDFRNAARLKTWSFHVWALARYPQKWLDYLLKMPESDKRLTPEEADAYFEEAFGDSRQDIEDSWRGWASGRALSAYATGYAPPRLPEKPNKDQIKGLERLNEFRELLGLGVAELDLEATLACKAHALFLQQNEDHWTWPEAHEEDPAKPGFTTRGMRAGMNSVIVIGNNPSDRIDPARSIDGWIGTVYHRFPLLRPNVRRIGFAAEGNVVVLDMGSLEKPQVVGGDEEPLKWVLWPAQGMTGVPTAFHVYESPDPLLDTPESKALPSEEAKRELQRRSGYPISLQMEGFIANQVQDARMTLWKAKKLGRTYVKDGDEIPMWVHTPRHPLLKRMEDPRVVFGIPKEHLEKREYYYVEVTLVMPQGEQKVSWFFETGSSAYGHGRLKIKPIGEK